MFFRAAEKISSSTVRFRLFMIDELNFKMYITSAATNGIK